MKECRLGIDDIMCDNIRYEDLHLASLAGMVDITCNDLTYDDINPDVCENVVMGRMILHVTI